MSKITKEKAQQTLNDIEELRKLIKEKTIDELRSILDIQLYEEKEKYAEIVFRGINCSLGINDDNKVFVEDGFDIHTEDGDLLKYFALLDELKEMANGNT